MKQIGEIPVWWTMCCVLYSSLYKSIRYILENKIIMKWLGRNNLLFIFSFSAFRYIFNSTAFPVSLCIQLLLFFFIIMFLLLSYLISSHFCPLFWIDNDTVRTVADCQHKYSVKNEWKTKQTREKGRHEIVNLYQNYMRFCFPILLRFTYFQHSK